MTSGNARAFVLVSHLFQNSFVHTSMTSARGSLFLGKEMGSLFSNREVQKKIPGLV
jgi:hypothetical protein